MNAKVVIGWELKGDQKRTLLAWLNFFCELDPSLVATHARMEELIKTDFGPDNIDDWNDLEKAESYCDVLDYGVWKVLDARDVHFRIDVTKHITEFFDYDSDVQTIITVGRVFISLYSIQNSTTVEDLKFWTGFVSRWKEEKRELIKNLTTIELEGEPMVHIVSDSVDHAVRD